MKTLFRTFEIFYNLFFFGSKFKGLFTVKAFKICIAAYVIGVLVNVVCLLNCLMNSEGLVKAVKVKRLNQSYVFAISQAIFKPCEVLFNQAIFSNLMEWISDMEERQFEEFIEKSAREHIARIRRYSLKAAKIMSFVYIQGTVGFILDLSLSHDLIVTMPFLSSIAHKNVQLLIQGYEIAFVAATIFIFDMFYLIVAIYIMAMSFIVKDAVKSLKFAEDRGKRLQSIQELHSEYIEKLNLYSEGTSRMLLLQLATSITALQMLLYIYRTLSNYLAGVYLLTVIVQIFLICFLCEILEVTTEDIYDEMCRVDWYEFDIKEQKHFLFCLQMAQRNYGLRAGGMYNINLMLFVQIMKLSYSYCTFMQAVVDQ
uniref:Odorant receptor n=1 Tax=Lutzomyia longipalpis TaxID=7200 RepID=A0A3F2ZDC0_LUTLO